MNCVSDTLKGRHLRSAIDCYKPSITSDSLRPEDRRESLGHAAVVVEVTLVSQIDNWPVSSRNLRAQHVLSAQRGNKLYNGARNTPRIGL